MQRLVQAFGHPPLQPLSFADPIEETRQARQRRSLTGVGGVTRRHSFRLKNVEARGQTPVSHSRSACQLCETKPGVPVKLSRRSVVAVATLLLAAGSVTTATATSAVGAAAANVHSKRVCAHAPQTFAARDAH